MPDEIDLLEQDLAALRPRAVSRALVTRIAAELDAPVVVRPFDPWKASPWVAAACVALAFGLLGRLPVGEHRSPRGADAAAGEQPASLTPVSARQVLYSSQQDEEILTLDDGRPARRVLDRYVDVITWKDVRTNASVRWSVPREEVRLVPVSYQ
jgi:hypothetical protein